MDKAAPGLEDGICGLVEDIPDIVSVAILTTTIVHLLGPLTTSSFQEAVKARYRASTQAGLLDGPCLRAEH
jgi:hypothetical protein